jgi:hypothetical protein
MADPITLVALENAALDAATLGDVATGPPDLNGDGTTTNRLGVKIKTIQSVMADLEADIASLPGLAPFYATRAEAVADLPVGAYFISNETDELRTYKRIAGAPFYEDQGDDAAPISKEALASSAGGKGSFLVNYRERTVHEKEADVCSVLDVPGIVGSDISVPAQAAIDEMSGRGGGIVLIPPGDWQCDNVEPKSNVTILAHGANITSSAANPIISTTVNINALGGGYALDPGVNYKAGDTTIALNSAGDAVHLTPGMFVNIRCRGIIGGAEAITPVSEINRVLSAVGTVVTLEYPLAKDYTYDAARDYTITPIDAYILENFHVRGGTWNAPGYRPLVLQNCWNMSVEGVALTGIGGVVIRGRHMRVCGNFIDLTPNWASGFRPYYFGCDTGSCDSIFRDNQCRSKGVGIVHLHEGCANILVEGNTLAQGETDAGAEVWAVVSILALSWNMSVLNNTIINSPTGDGILSKSSTAYVNEGNVRLAIRGNKILGTMASHGIQHTQGSLDHGVVIADNTIDAVCNVAGNYQLGITTAPGVFVAGNISSTGINLIDQATLVADATRIVGNWGIADNIKKFIGTHEFNAQVGAPTQIAWRGARGTIWSLDAAAQETIDACAMAPAGASQVYAYLWWANLGAGAGSARLAVSVSTGISDTETANQADTSLILTAVALAQDVATRTFMGTLSVDDLTFLPLRVSRVAADAADTLANDIGIIGVELIFR